MDMLQLRLAAMDFAVRSHKDLDENVVNTAQDILDFLTNSQTVTEVVA